jgi:hypothetical protein
VSGVNLAVTVEINWAAFVMPANPSHIAAMAIEYENFRVVIWRCADVLPFHLTLLLR